jgi:hypothetical protein
MRHQCRLEDTKTTNVRLAAILGIVVAAPSAILLYGYWFSRTHGAAIISVVDVSDPNHVHDLKPVHLALLDDAGRTLAEADTLPADGPIYLTGPSRYACHEIELRAPFSTDARTQWDECFERQSRWVPAWIRHVRFATVSTGSCTIDRAPVTVAEYPDRWWLWWVPLPHIGGKPYTSFTLRIEVDRRSRCGPS